MGFVTLRSGVISRGSFQGGSPRVESSTRRDSGSYVWGFTRRGKGLGLEQLWCASHRGGFTWGPTRSRPSEGISRVGPRSRVCGGVGLREAGAVGLAGVGVGSRGTPAVELNGGGTRG